MVNSRRVVASTLALFTALTLAPVASAAGIDREAGWWGTLERLATRIALLVGITPDKDDGRAEMDGNGSSRPPPGTSYRPWSGDHFSPTNRKNPLGELSASVSIFTKAIGTPAS